jgi:hypothetical protein
MKAAREALARQDYATAMARAGEALGLKANDPDASKLIGDAKAQQDASMEGAQREKDYQSAIKSATDKLNAGDYAEAMMQADAALMAKPSDVAALKLKANAKAEQDAALSRQQREKDFQNAINTGSTKLTAGDFAGAITEAETALGIKPNDSRALKLKADATARIAATSAQQKQKDYETAMLKGGTALTNKEYQEAVNQAMQALQAKPGDQAAAELKASAQSAKQGVSTQDSQEDKFKKTLGAAQSAFDSKDYATASQQADLALSFRANDSGALELKQRSSQIKDLQDAQAHVDRGEYAQAMALCAAHPGVDAFTAIVEQIKKKQLNDLDSNLELYLVWFGVLNSKDAKTAKAQSADARRKAQDLAMEELPIQDVNYYLSLADGLERAYKAGSWLDDERKKNLNALRKSIQNHQ